MRDRRAEPGAASAAAVGPPPSATDVLGDLARRLHGQGEILEKLAWLVDQARHLTRASHGVFVGADARGGLTMASGPSADEMERFARPLVRRLLAPGRVAGRKI